MQFTLDIWSLLFLIASTQGLFFGIVLLTRKSANRYLGAVLLSFSLMMLYYVAYWTNIHHLLPRSLAMLQGATYLIGIWLYFYFKSPGGKLYFNSWHFIPVLIYIGLFYSFTRVSVVTLSWLITIQAGVQIAHLMLYFILNQRLIHHQDIRKKSNSWHRKINLAFGGYVASFIAYYIMVWTNTLQLEYDYFVSLTAAVFIYLIGFYGFRKPELLKQTETARYATSSVNFNVGKGILMKLEQYFNKEQPHLNGSLKITEVSTQLGFSVHQISQVLNEHRHMGFNDYLNHMRIEHAILLMKQNRFEKLIDIAYSSGFNNKNTFNNAFKKVTGHSPTAYKAFLANDPQPV